MRRKKRFLKVLKFPKQKFEDKTGFIDTLVYLLDQARQGKVIAYSTVYIIDLGEKERVVEGANFSEPYHADKLLGQMRRAELEFIKRNWPSE